MQTKKRTGFTKELREIIQKHVGLTERLAQITDCVVSDLYYGPKYTTTFMTEKGEPDWSKWTEELCVDFASDLDEIEGLSDHFIAMYTSPPANELRDFISNLPSELWIDDGGFVLENEPQPWTDDDGKLQEPFWEDYTVLRGREVVEAVFGSTIAKEFR